MFKKIFFSFFVGLFFVGKIAAQSVDYYLPYPGILPDHPLYWLKMVRDRIGLVITSGETAKAGKLLLYADKRLGAAWALIDGGKQSLGVSTLTKAEKYLEQAVNSPSDAAIKDRLGKAVLKHEEVIVRLKAQAEAGYEPALDEMLVKLALLKDKLGTAVKQSVEVKVDFGQDSAVIKNLAAATALEALEKAAADEVWQLVIKDYDFGKLVTAVGEKANSKDRAWIFYVNGAAGEKASDQTELNWGDKVDWKYEKVKP